MKVKVTPETRKKAKGKKRKTVPEKKKAAPVAKKPMPVAKTAAPVAKKPTVAKTKAAATKRPEPAALPLHTDARLKRMLALVDLSPDIIAIVSPACRVVFWNAGAVAATGRHAKQANGANFFELLEVAQRNDLTEAFAKVADGGEWEGEFNVPAEDGTERTLHGRWKFLPANRNAAACVLMVHRDITESKKAAMGSLRAQRLDSAGELACTIAHDLNNVLAPIVIGADALEALSQGSESADVVKLIKDSAQRAAKIVRQVLLFVRGHDEEESPAAVKGAEAPAHFDPPQANGELIIVADDEPVIAELCRCVLESHGYRAEVASDGVAALALFDQYRSSVRAVVSDLAMPFMDGVDLTRAIRRLDPNVPILIATGAADAMALRRLEPFARVALLAKPYTQRGLIDALQSALAPAEKK